MNDIIKIFEKPLPSTRSGAFFNAFSYPTKISPEWWSKEYQRREADDL